MVMKWNIEFFREDSDRMPAREWLKALPFASKSAAIAAIEFVLVDLGPTVCSSEQGEDLGDGLFELWVRHEEGAGPAGDGEPVSLRIFCHAREKTVVLMSGIDETAAPGERRRRMEIETARRRLRSLRLRHARQEAGKRRHL
jgi:hypothetical protein